ncbi:hypothetical protein [Caballeronia sordidicola]|uniref:Uncharacterized protein n=1 Tax=Caballeronia sordidicola TaxID=196367 RepID=A0A242MT42_CABSO|nr:hypothetical protein [Caballeronia sordidicola]OTP74438.1 hypothetical protein PAMC26510_16490 [Caballeronia sordidicola]
MTTAKDILDAFREKFESGPPIINGMYLAKAWQGHLAATEPFVKPFTQRNKLDLQGWIEKAGPDRALLAVHYVFDNWRSFVSEVAQLKGLGIVPTKPSFEFTNRHFDVVLILLES